MDIFKNSHNLFLYSFRIHFRRKRAMSNKESRNQKYWRYLYIFLFISLMLSCSPEWNEEEKAVISTVEGFFNVLSTKDSTTANKLILPSGYLTSIRPDSTIRMQSHQAFLQNLVQMDDDLLERMWNPRVMIHNQIAIVWTPYDFHLNGQWSHCGVEAFSLVKTEQGWQIAGVIYTVEKEGCKESPLGPVE